VCGSSTVRRYRKLSSRPSDNLGESNPFSVFHDLRYAIRRLRNSPGFSTVAIATIALAVGANTAMFSLVNGLFLSPLPYPDPDRIVRLLERHPNGGINGISTLNYLDWTTQNSAFDYIAAETGWSPTLTDGNEAVVIRGARVSAQYFEIFGVQAAVGRTFRSGDDQPANDRVVLLSHRLWESRFGADRALVGREIRLNGEGHTVIGILPEGGPFDRAVAEIWKPLAFQPAQMTRGFRWLGGTARLKQDVALDQARARMDVIGQRLARAYPDSNTGWGVAVDRLQDVLIGPQLQAAITILFAATALVLLIGCVNLANLGLARSISRDGEMAVRAAVGASRADLVRQVLVENVVISLCGGIVGIGVGYALLTWIQSLIPLYALPPAVDIDMDTSVLLFALIVAVLTGLLFGIAPASQVMSRSLAATLKERGLATTAGSRGRRTRSALVIAEVALAFVLLVASGLLMRSFFKLLDVDPGFTAENVLTARVPISQQQHADPIDLNAYVASVRAAVEAVPGVREAALTSALPLQGWGYGVPYAIAGRERSDPVNRRPAFFKIVSPSYFRALGITLRAGRVLSETDTAGAPPVAVINDTLARREFADENPIGRRILMPKIVPGTTELGEEIAWEIVGVVAGEKITGLGDAISGGVYVSDRQNPTYDLSLVVRASVPPQSLERSVRSAVARVNKDQAIGDVQTLEQIVERSMLATRTTSSVLAVFAAMALLLAVMGIYGVTAYMAAQRTHEMGIRAALGAGASDLRNLILRGGMRLTLIGLSIGLAGTFAATRVMSSLLYGVRADDPLTIAAVLVVLFAVAALACLLAARRMTNTDPMEALRHQ
jgi:putative ABC transport system permease protein